MVRKRSTAARNALIVVLVGAAIVAVSGKCHPIDELPPTVEVFENPSNDCTKPGKSILKQVEHEKLTLKLEGLPSTDPTSCVGGKRYCLKRVDGDWSQMERIEICLGHKAVYFNDIKGSEP